MPKASNPGRCLPLAILRVPPRGAQASASPTRGSPGFRGSFRRYDRIASLRGCEGGGEEGGQAPVEGALVLGARDAVPLVREGEQLIGDARLIERGGHHADV